MKITKGSAAWVGIGAIIAALSGFFFSWVVARGLGPAGTGVVISFATWFTMLLTLGKLGTDTAVMWEGARSVAGATPFSTGRFLRWSLAVVTPVAVVVSIGLYIAAPQAARVLATDDLVNTTAVVRVGAVLLPFAIVGFILLAGLRGIGQAVPYVSVEQIIKPVLRVLGALALLAFGVSSVLAFSVAWAIPTIIGFVITLALVYVARDRLRKHAPGPRGESRQGIRELWKFAGPRAVNQGVDIISASVGVVVLALMSTATETGLFGTAIRIVLAGQLAYHAVRLLISPVIAHGLAVGDVPAVQRLYTSANSLVVAFSWPLYLLAFGAAGIVLSLFGPGFEAATGMLRILVVVAMVIALLGNMQTVVLMSGASRAALVATTVGLVLNLAVTIALAHTLGGIAAALGWAVGTLAEAALLARVMHSMDLRPAARETLVLAGRTMLVLGGGAVAIWLVPSLIIGVVVFIGAGLVWVVWCRKLVMTSWQQLTSHNVESTGEQSDEREQAVSQT